MQTMQSVGHFDKLYNIFSSPVRVLVEAGLGLEILDLERTQDLDTYSATGLFSRLALAC